MRPFHTAALWAFFPQILRARFDPTGYKSPSEDGSGPCTGYCSLPPFCYHCLDYIAASISYSLHSGAAAPQEFFRPDVTETVTVCKWHTFFLGLEWIVPISHVLLDAPVAVFGRILSSTREEWQTIQRECKIFLCNN